ncbi:hypothetical protein Tco_0944657 [Tanacetum coccineum]
MAQDNGNVYVEVQEDGIGVRCTTTSGLVGGSVAIGHATGSITLYEANVASSDIIPRPRWQSQALPLVGRRWRVIQGLKLDDWKFVMIQGLGLKLKDAPQGLESSLARYK